MDIAGRKIGCFQCNVYIYILIFAGSTINLFISPANFFLLFLISYLIVNEKNVIQEVTEFSLLKSELICIVLILLQIKIKSEVMKL